MRQSIILLCRRFVESIRNCHSIIQCTQTEDIVQSHLPCIHERRIKTARDTQHNNERHLHRRSTATFLFQRPPLGLRRKHRQRVVPVRRQDQLAASHGADLHKAHVTTVIVLICTRLQDPQGPLRRLAQFLADGGGGLGWIVGCRFVVTPALIIITAGHENVAFSIQNEHQLHVRPGSEPIDRVAEFLQMGIAAAVRFRGGRCHDDDFDGAGRGFFWQGGWDESTLVVLLYDDE